MSQTSKKGDRKTSEWEKPFSNNIKYSMNLSK